MLREFFALEPEVKQQFVVPGCARTNRVTPGLLVETAASSDEPDWKEMLNWASPIPQGHPLKRKFPTAYPDQVLPESAVPGITEGAVRVPRRDRRSAASLPARDRRRRSVPRDVLRRHGARRPTLDSSDPLPTDGRDHVRWSRVGRRPRRHQPHHRAATCHGAGPAGAGRRRMGRCRGASRAR